MLGVMHNLYAVVVEKGLAENSSDDLEEVAVPGHRFRRKGADGKGTSKFTSPRVEYTLGGMTRPVW